VFEPLVSIVIPLFNKETWIVQTLATVYNQTYKNWECLIINDGSTDQSLSRVLEFTEGHPANWVIIDITNSGQAFARNRGIEIAKGELVSFLDADDLWHPNKLKSQIELFSINSKVELVLSSYVIFKENQSRSFRMVKNKSASKLVESWFDMRGFGGLIESTGMIKKSALIECGNFSDALSMASGLDLCLRVVRTRQTIVSPVPYVFYRLSDGQFHKNEDVLKRDMEITCLRHSTTVEIHEKLRMRHANYFYWSESRSLGVVRFLQRTLLAILVFDIPKLISLYFLITRNLLAFFRGFYYQAKIQAFFQAHKSTL